jgi:hypothetical protein
MAKNPEVIRDGGFPAEGAVECSPGRESSLGSEMARDLIRMASDWRCRKPNARGGAVCYCI